MIDFRRPFLSFSGGAVFSPPHPGAIIPRLPSLLLAEAFLILSACGAVAQQQGEDVFDKLPAELRLESFETLEGCKEVYKDYQPELMANRKPWMGITVIDLDGTGAEDVVWDAKAICGTAIPGGNCDKWDTCPLKIYKQTSPTTWKKVFDEYVVSDNRFFSFSSSGRKYMTITIHGKNNYCAVDESSKFAACDVTLHWKNGRFSK